MSASAEMTADTETSYDKLGGEAGVRALARRFYEIMDRDPAYKALRDLHASELGSVSESFAGFLSVWLGGPRDWLTQRGGFCLMSRHAGMGITQETAEQWVSAMREAMDQTVPDRLLKEKMDDAFTRLAEAMAWRGAATPR
ncbi:group II truncated hemoglobin [Acidocella sp.]|uniref:group II truncated hemoglobin n=1 Tax=Acidocella sp. TaxID=50710 RepID=UPI003CFCEA36